MSIARALTVRLRRNGASPPTSPLPADATAMSKRMGGMLDRSKISSPVELISSTNMLSYDAPDVAVVRQQRQASASSSDDGSTADDSDRSSANLRISTEDLTDASSVEASPVNSPEHNHLSCYFEAAQHESKRSSLRRSASSSRVPPITRARSPDPLAPAIPHRALSHSKSSHLALARKRSLQSLTNPSSSRSGTASATISRSNSQRDLRLSSYSTSSATSPSFSTAPADGTSTSNTHLHPFGRELEKLSEVVEELSGVMRDAEDEDDAEVMREHGLSRWTADEYLHELRPLYTMGFGAAGQNHPAAVVPAWI